MEAKNLTLGRGGALKPRAGWAWPYQGWVKINLMRGRGPGSGVSPRLPPSPGRPESLGVAGISGSHSPLSSSTEPEESSLPASGAPPAPSHLGRGGVAQVKDSSLGGWQVSCLPL